MVISSLLFAACGDSTTGKPSNVGSISFSVQWVRTEDSSALPQLNTLALTAAPIDCRTAWIVTVEATAHDGSGTKIASGGPWASSDDIGAIYNIPARSVITCVVIGKDASNSIIYRGSQGGISIIDGQVTPVGTIIADYFVPGLTVPITGAMVTAGNYSLSWSGTAPFYQVQISADSAFSSNATDTTISASIYVPSNLSAGTYYWRVRGKDSYGYVSGWTSSNSFTLQVPPDVIAPTNTTGSNFINGGASSTSSASVTLALSATDNTGVTGYFAAETAAAPASTDAGWIVISASASYSADVSYALSAGTGTKTVYVWFKDAAGNVSNYMSDSIIVSNTAYEIEPNNDFSTAQVVSAAIDYIGQDNGTSDGNDYFKITASGSSMTVNLAHVTQDASGSNFGVTIYNSTQTQIGAFNANAGVDNSMTLGVSAGSYYFIKIYVGSTTYQYKLKVTFP